MSQRHSTSKIDPLKVLKELRCCVALGSLRNHGETQRSEIAVKSERRHVIEKRGYDYK
jgi:hypothetical protein